MEGAQEEGKAREREEEAAALLRGGVKEESADAKAGLRKG